MKTLLTLFCLIAAVATADEFHDLLNADRSVRETAAASILEKNDPASIPLVAEACFYYTILRDSSGVEEMSDILKKLTGHGAGKKYFDWLRWIGMHPEIRPLPGYIQFKARVLSGIDPAFAAFFEDETSFTIRPEEIVWGGVKKDGIPALVNPPVVAAREAKYWKDNDRVLGAAINQAYRAYPLRIMDWHEMANDTLGGVRIVIPYCTLCGSAILYKATAGDTAYTFGSSGLLYRSNKLMYDRETNSLWSALAGEPVSGSLAGKGLKLEILPIIVTTWGEWRRRHPDTTVLNIATGHNRDYNVEPYKDYFASDKNMFPVPLENNQLGMKDFVFALRLGKTKRAYPMEIVAAKKMLVDTLDGVRVVLVADPSARSARAYRCDNDEQPLELWAATEEDLHSPDGKSSCRRLPGHVAYWFGWYAQFPETELYAR